jgi:predicted Rossmann fold nucleotide-binding protein DprA/Smf involved in DNA uptake
MKLNEALTKITRLHARGLQYGNKLTLSPGLVSPAFVDIIGSDKLLASRKIGLLCSIQCPGDIILKTLDLMQELRTTGVCVVSGFHSPLEQECLKILLRGACGIVLCYARGLPKRVPSEYRKPISDGRMLLLSSFDEAQGHATRDTSRLRNELVVALGDVVVIPYAAPGGMTEKVFKDAVSSGKPVFVFQEKHSSSLGVVDNDAMFISGAATLLQNLPPIDGVRLVGRHETAQPMVTGTDDRKYCLPDIRRVHPRAYEKWTDEEEARLAKLRNAGKSKQEIARDLHRQPGAISSRLRKLGF